MRKLFKLGHEFHGGVPVVFAWDPRGNYLATGVSNGIVHVFNRHGEHVVEISPQCAGAAVAVVDWDDDGEILAVLQNGHEEIALYDVRSRRAIPSNLRLEDPTWLKWSRSGPLLAIGSSSGNLQIYNKETQKIVRCMGKHPSGITCGAWSRDQRLALGSNDCTMTLSNKHGDTQVQRETQRAPRELRFTHQQWRKDGCSSNGLENTVSAIMADGKTLLLYHLESEEEPVELAFCESYGTIVAHHWFGNDFLVLGFSRGYVVVVPSADLGEELNSHDFHSALYGIAFSPVMNLVATIGDGGVKIIDVAAFKELESEAIYRGTNRSSEHRPRDIAWSPDGSILTVSTQSGTVYNFLAKMPTTTARCGPKVAFLSSLREVTVLDVAKERPPTLTVAVEIEPTFMAIGTEYLAVGMNNRVQFYRFSPHASSLVSEQEYMGSVREMALNGDCAAALVGRRVLLHALPGSESAGPGSIDRVPRPRLAFPEDHGDQESVLCMALSDHSLICGMDSGGLRLFSIPDWKATDADFHHEAPVVLVAPNSRCTRVAFVDSMSLGYVFNPALGEVYKIPGVPLGVTRIMWDETDKHVFYIFTPEHLHVFAFADSTIHGSRVEKVGRASISDHGDVKVQPEVFVLPCAGDMVLACQGGYILHPTSSGGVERVLVPAFSSFDRPAVEDGQRLLLRFQQCVALLLLREAWDISLELDQRKCYLAVAAKAVEHMDTGLAICAYRQLGDAGMVHALERVAHVEDRNLLAGYMCMIRGDYTSAQNLFLSSTYPVAALDMAMDLMQWEQALHLARNLAVDQVPAITAKLAQHLELRENYEGALRTYEDAERALRGVTSDGAGAGVGAGGGRDASTGTGAGIGTIANAAVQEAVTHGLARCALRLGDLHRGLKIARSADDAQLCGECAKVLEAETSETYLYEAASLYHTGGFYEDAARIYLKNCDLRSAAPIMKHVTKLTIQARYAKACEGAGQYREAATAYGRAHDTDSVVRLHLHKLQEPGRALDLVRETRSASGAEMVAEYCQQRGDIGGAIEFYLMANRSRQAFEYARDQDALDVLASRYGDSIDPRDAAQLARYYEQKGDLGKAGHFYGLCGDYGRALKLFLECGEAEIDAAIDVVGRANDDACTHDLVDFIMGEKDGLPKDAKYVYRLQVALGNFRQAGDTAVLVARQEQEMGNYKAAHEMSYLAIRQLEDKGVQVPRELRKGFQLLHSYMLAQQLVKRGNHASAARMLLRVANNISRFPKHAVSTLTLAFIECQRAGLRRSAHRLASKLVHSDYRVQLDPKHARKIEKVVRRPELNEPSEETSPCPISGQHIPRTQLDCPTTRDPLPMCIISGHHVERDDFCLCPNSGMPAIYSLYQAHIEAHASAMVMARPAAGNPGGAATQGMPGGVHEGRDPILGLPVRRDALKRWQPTEVDEYIAKLSAPPMVARGW